MVNLLGKSTNHFNAIAPLFSQQITSTGFLTPLKELSVFQVNGENDDLIPLDGGQSPVGIFMSAEESAYNWANHFNCNTDAVQEELNWGDTSVNSFTFLNCNNNNEIKYMIALNTGHGLDNQAEQIIYNEIWDFFKQY
jgi:poly(3-hydroxybutyrate) depolymerase